VSESVGPPVGDARHPFSHRLDQGELLFIDADAQSGRSFGHTLPFLLFEDSGM
jgi:hypothetical protein